MGVNVPEYSERKKVRTGCVRGQTSRSGRRPWQGCLPSPTSAVLPGPASHPPQSLVYSPPRQFQKQEQSACLTLSHQSIKHWYSQNLRTGWQKSMVHNVVCEEWCGKTLPSELDLHTKFCLGKGTDGSDSVKADWLNPLLATCFPRGFGCVI